MPTVGRLMDDGELQIAGELNERLPAVTDGLVAHFPMDGTHEYVPSRGLCTYFSFDGELVDYVGGLYLTGNSPIYTDNGLQLTNSTSFITGTTDVLNTDYHTIAFKLRLDTAADGTWRKIFGYTPSGTDRSPGIWRDPTHNTLHWKYDPNNTGGSTLNPTGDNTTGGFTVGKWYSIIGVKDGANFHFYVNGEFVVTSTVSNPKYAGTAPLWFGGANVTLQDFRIYNRVLSSDEVKYLGSPHITNSNTTLTYDGIAVEEGTTNLVSNPCNFNAWGDNWNNTVIDSFSVPGPFGDPADYIHGDPSQHTLLYQTIGIPASSTNDYYASVYVKPVSIEFITFNVYYGGNAEDNVSFNFRDGSVSGVPYAGEYIFEKLSAGWYRIGYRMTRDSSASRTTIWYRIWTQGRSLDSPGDVCLWGAQLEQKPYLTSFVQSNRSGSLLDLDPSLINITNGTISLDLYWEGEKYSNPSNPWMMIVHSTSNNGESDKINLCVHNGTLRTRFSNGTTNTYLTGFPVSQLSSGWNTYTVTWDSSANTAIECLNGTVQSMTSVNLPAINPTHFHIGTWCGSGLWANMILRNLSIYNRTLTDEEIKALSTTSFSPDSEGNVYTPTLIERPNYDTSLNGVHIDDVIPLTEENTVNEASSGVWVGEATTNYISNGNFNSGTTNWGLSGSGTSDWEVIDNSMMHVWPISGFGGGNMYFTGTDITLSPNTTYTLSCKYMQPTSNTSNFFYIQLMQSDWAVRLSRLDLFEADGKWHTANITIATNSTTSYKILVCWDTAQQGDNFYITDIQLEQRSFPTPFTPYSRGASKLYYPATLVDVAQDFTIFGWYKMVAPNTDSYEGILTRDDGSPDRILIMGESGSSDYMRCWYGDATTGVSFYTSNGRHTFTQGLNKWRFFCLRRSGSTMALFDGLDGILYSGTDSNGALLDNKTISNPWQVGTWGTGSNRMNGYVRDYVFLQSALSDAEIENIFRTGISNHTNHLRISNKLVEGAVL